jgi:hypothetical protein
MYHLIWWMFGRAVLKEAGRSWHSSSNAPAPFAGKLSLGHSLFMHRRDVVSAGKRFWHSSARLISLSGMDVYLKRLAAGLNTSAPDHPVCFDPVLSV